MLIGVLADTHIPLRARSLPAVVCRAFAGVDLIIHAGDLVGQEVLAQLGALAPVAAVYGNVDGAELRRQLPRTRVVEAEGWRIGVVHGDGPGGSTPNRAARTFRDVHCVVFGHSHRPLCERSGELLLFNPGSPTDRRTCAQHSYGLLHATAGGIAGEIIGFGP